MIPLSRTLIDEINSFFYFSTDDLALYLIPGNAFENFADEIGLLRELTYRQKLSGSGQNKDLDGRDQHYDHFILIDQQTFTLAGTARLQFVPATRDPDQPTTQHGSQTSYLEHTYPGIKQCLASQGHHLEIGRVAISPGFQKQPASLMSLFRGGLQAAYSSGYSRIFGLVSYNHFQYPGLVNDFFLNSLMHPPFHQRNADLPAPRHPRPFRGNEPLASADCDSVQQLEAQTRQLHSEFRLPILLRQYINLMAAKTQDLSIAKDFNQITEIMMSADLNRVPERRLQHFIGFTHNPIYRLFPWYRGQALP
jgi:hypothetical protein